MLKYLALAAVLFVGVGYLAYLRFFSEPGPISQERFDALYSTPAPAPAESSSRVFHLGHSLVGRMMPAMLAQLAASQGLESYEYESQLGWGTRLNAHWEPDVRIKGYDEENDHSRFRDAKEALASGDYDTVVLTEGVEIRDSIKYGKSSKYLAKWAEAARAGNPDVRVYFYESWHGLDDEEGWLNRLDRDLELYWENAILKRALAYEENPQAIYLIPAGQVMAAVTREIEGGAGVGPIKTRSDLFRDDIHFNDYGAYLVALTHFAVLFQTSPVGLPHALLKPNGEPAEDMGSEAAEFLQQIVWDTVRTYPRTGLK